MNMYANRYVPLWHTIEDQTQHQLPTKLPKTPDPVKERQLELLMIEKEIAESRRSWASMTIADPRQRLADKVRMAEHHRNIEKTQQLKEIYKDKAPLFAPIPNRIAAPYIEANYIPLPVTQTLTHVQELLAKIKGAKS